MIGCDKEDATRVLRRYMTNNIPIARTAFHESTKMMEGGALDLIRLRVSTIFALFWPRNTVFPVLSNIAGGLGWILVIGRRLFPWIC